ncbi:tetratricopeptide repeat protein [Actibacterium ureilyticum]|uniref:tetratricopeptide repeat protein n=1 Tax=Actibacterium ureilyticum TaxID=1590614 RepID=UPI000BAAF944|nr:tetratricopeptide repeat protein [Actibacterium ureilyticum]
MSAVANIHNRIVAAIFAICCLSGAVQADEKRVDDLFDLLAQDNLPNWQVIEDEIWLEWSKSGSAAMDLLLERGRAAMESGDFPRAVEHLTALTDHAPDFAEGFNARATAYYRMGFYGPSLADIRTVLTLNPRHFGALSGLGTILEEIGEEDRALGAYQAAAAVHPHKPELQDAVKRLERAVSGDQI